MPNSSILALYKVFRRHLLLYGTSQLPAEPSRQSAGNECQMSILARGGWELVGEEPRLSVSLGGLEACCMLPPRGPRRGLALIVHNKKLLNTTNTDSYFFPPLTLQFL